jgi:hypothetical protein
MAGKIIADTIESAGSQISLNVGNVTILTASSTGLTLTPTSNVNINVSNSNVTFTNATVTGIATFAAGTAALPSITATGDTNTGIYFPAADTIAFSEGGAESMRIDSGGNMIIGGISPTTSSGYTSLSINNATNSGYLILQNNGTNKSDWYVSGGTVATLRGVAVPLSLEATGANHVKFETNGSERMRIDSSGNIFTSGNYSVLYPGSGNTTTGIFLESSGQLSCSRDNTVVARFNRNSTDGTLLSLSRQGTEIGTVSVSSGTVSYNAFAGSHWSQLSDGSKPVILRGTVLDSINELVQWPDEPTTERLCKVKVSNTVGSKKVYGVFMDWDNDWTATNDMYVTAVGAFICRVNASVTVQEGDLLESNGDGTARVQADDIIRSSTIGKVTCTEKTHQYDDGSYCVPTVLYCG